MIKLKRIFEKASPDDGYRILVDRLWPRGVRKESLALDYWAKELSPSEELREFYHRDSKRWLAFRTRYREELKAPAAVKTLYQLADTAKTAPVTLIFGSHELERNNASVIKEILESILKS